MTGLSAQYATSQMTFPIQHAVGSHLEPLRLLKPLIPRKVMSSARLVGMYANYFKWKKSVPPYAALCAARKYLPPPSQQEPAVLAERLWS